MKNARAKLWFRLTIAFLFVALIGILLVAFLANQAASAGFTRYLQVGQFSQLNELQNDLLQFYTDQGGWAGVNRVLRASGAGPDGTGGGYFLRVLDVNGEVVASRGGQGQALADFSIELALDEGDRPIGTLLAEPAGGGSRAGEQYLASLNQAIIWAGLVAVLVAMLVGLVLARRLTHPLRQMAQATQAIAAGDLDQQVPVTSQDELGQLAEDFNQMAHALALSEQQRRQLLADTAHDLRTPISIIQSHLEAMLDGVFPMTQENLARIHEETLHLGRLVEDVRTLSLAESGRLPLEKRPLDMAGLTNRVVSSFLPLAEVEGVQLTGEISPVGLLMADEARIHQVQANLIANALRFAVQNQNGQPVVRVSLREEGQQVVFSVADNGPGLTADQQQRVFDRFWRSDAARDRQKGGSGLGLAIAKSIVEAHGGQITVRSEPGQGAVFSTSMPLL
jgi:signal transduction histidine kinase